MLRSLDSLNSTFYSCANVVSSVAAELSERWLGLVKTVLIGNSKATMRSLHTSQSTQKT